MLPPDAMPRIRTLKPEALQHRKVGPLSDRAFRVWIGLITQADDDGRVVAEPQQLRVLLFAYHRKVTETQVEAALLEIAAAGLIDLYEARGTRYAAFPSWRDHQRIHRQHYTPSRLPPPPNIEKDSSTVPVLDQSSTATGPVPSESGRKGMEGNGTEGKGGEWGGKGAKDLSVDSVDNSAQRPSKGQYAEILRRIEAGHPELRA